MGSVEQANGLRVVARYDDGAPMDYAEVEISIPADGSVFQTGRTDRNGVFMFLPDQSGKWRIAVRDGLGHQLVLGHQVPSTPSTETEQPEPETLQSTAGSLRQGLMAGVGAIFGLFGLLYAWKARKQIRR